MDLGAQRLRALGSTSIKPAAATEPADGKARYQLGLRLKPEEQHQQLGLCGIEAQRHGAVAPAAHQEKLKP